MPSDSVALSISLDEVNDMLKRWDVGLVRELAPMIGGSRTSPKLKLTAERGVFVLKRRPNFRADLERIRFAHQVMISAGAAGLPIALAQPARDGSTFQVHGDGIYELFLFLNGERWKRAPRQAHEAGRALATLHQSALQMQWHGHVNASCFHGNLMVVEALRRVPAAIAAAQPSVNQGEVAALCEKLSSLYQQASEQVDQLEYEHVASQVVHGDWHPGNILFDGERVSGVLDFDSARLEPAIADVANGLLQYSIRAGPSRAVAQWPHELDEQLFSSFATGFANVGTATLNNFVNMVPWLMIEACIAEASIPIARSGMFATIPGDHMLALIVRRATWLQSNAANLARRLYLDLAP